MSTNQSFVGAYARRHRSARLAATNPSPTTKANDQSQQESPVDSDVVVEKPSQPGELHPMLQGLAAQSTSFAHTTSPAISPEEKTVWIGGNDDGQMFRVDTPPAPTAPEVAVPKSEIAEPEILERASSPSSSAPTSSSFATEDTLQSIAETAPTAERNQSAQSHSTSSQFKLAPLWQGANWEVDAFAIPSSVADLFFDESFFHSIAEHLRQSVQSGLRNVMITSIDAGAGRSTVAIGTAIAAAAAGLTVALVDLDIESPDLADTLRLETESDWLTAIRHGDPLESISVASIEDNVTLVPLSPTDGRSLPVTSMEIDRLMTKLSGCFDLVIFDGCPVGSWSCGRAASAVDSSLIVRDARTQTQEQIAEAAQALRFQGVRGIGVVDNFCRS